MSYDDMLNLFGPGTKPPDRASATTVSALPESRVTEEEVARMRRAAAEGGGGGGGASKDWCVR